MTDTTVPAMNASGKTTVPAMAASGGTTVPAMNASDGTTVPAMNASVRQAVREQDLVERVVASFNDCPDPRLRQVMSSLTRHLHAFLRDVRLTEPEWNTAIQFLTDTGHITDDKRQEFILLSDVLGASMQTVTVNNEAHGNATEATVFGPFFLHDSPEISAGGDIAGGAPGMPCWVEGTVIDTDGNPVPRARIEVWEADENGLYDVQYPDERIAGRAHLFSDHDGRYAFWGLRPTPYPIPHDGPVGMMLAAVGRSPIRASHLHFMVTAAGYRTLVTHIFVENDPQLEVGDSVFGVKDSLIKRFEDQRPGTPAPDGRQLAAQAWSRARFDIVLAPHS